MAIDVEHDDLIKQVEILTKKKLTQSDKDNIKVKRISGFPDYWIANVGVPFTKSGTAFKTIDLSDERGPQIKLAKGGVTVLKFISDLVALTFLERPTELQDKSDNELEAYYLDENHPVKACASNLGLRLKTEMNNIVAKLESIDINDQEVLLDNGNNNSFDKLELVDINDQDVITLDNGNNNSFDKLELVDINDQEVPSDTNSNNGTDDNDRFELVNINDENLDVEFRTTMEIFDVNGDIITITRDYDNHVVIWKTREGFSKYEVSSTGIVRSKKGQKIELKVYPDGRIKPSPDNGKPDWIPIAKFVALSFIPYPAKYNIKEDKLNAYHISGSSNHIFNIAWRTASDDKQIRNAKKEKKKVEQYSLGGEYITTYESAQAAGEAVGLSSITIQVRCSTGKNNGKYIWKYTVEDQKKTAIANEVKASRQQQIEKAINDGKFTRIGKITMNTYVNGTKTTDQTFDFSNYAIYEDGSRIINMTKLDEKKYELLKGYLCVKLPYGGDQPKTLTVHKIINQVLMGGKYDDIIDHLNMIKSDNTISNMEVVTLQENTIRAIGRSVHQLDRVTGKSIQTFRTIKEAAAFHNIKCSGNISVVCCGGRPTAGGFGWKYVDEDEDSI
jgi:hypothetical protein